MEISFIPMIARVVEDSIAALEALTPLEQSLAGMLLFVQAGALVVLRTLGRRPVPAEPVAELDEAA